MKSSATQPECRRRKAAAKRLVCSIWPPKARHYLSLSICIFVVLILTLSSHDAAVAQAPATSPVSVDEDDQASPGNKDLVDDVFLRPSRDLVLRLNNARRLIERQRYSEAVRLLGWLLDCDEDYFVCPEDDNVVFKSLKSQARDLIGRMPRVGRDLYELEYGAKARARLEEATAKQDAAGLALVSRRYFHTEAGGEATLLLGLWYLDHGRPLAAALILSRLSESTRVVVGEEGLHEGTARLEPTLSMAMAVCWAQAGIPSKANECLESLRSRFPSGRVMIGGEEVALFATGEDPLEWLESRTGTLFATPSSFDKGTVDDGIPLLNTLWRVSPSEHPSADRLLLSQMQFCRERDRSIITTGIPLAVGNVVLMRTVSTLQAVDFQTGKRLWMVPFDDILDNAATLTSNPHRQHGQQTGTLCHRYWQDGIYGSLSSNDTLVFSVEGILAEGGISSRHLAVMGMGGRLNNSIQPGTYNRLTAHNINNGKLIWQVGGKPRGKQAAPVDIENTVDAEEVLPAAGSFFLGAPLCLAGRLYALAEFDGEIRLLALEASSGKLLWTQPLAMSEFDILQNWPRRLRAVTPSYADGILVCPTGNGAVVAVEEATHSLLWGYPFPEESKKNSSGRLRQQRIAMGMAMPGYGRHSGEGRLHDNLKIVDDKVIASAPGGEYLYCLGLFDGKQHWKTPLKGDLFIACADSERIVLVGSHHARALKMSDGKAAWKQSDVHLGDGASTSGRGFLAGGYYYLPVGKAGVAVLDVQNGRVERLAKSREGNMPGNLICHKGKVLSQGLDGLKSYYELGTLRRRVESILAKQPDDARALALQGEILIDQNKRKQAIDSLRRSYEHIGGARTEWLLRETLLDGLAEDFAQYRQEANEIEKLCKDAHHRARYLRLTAEGLEGLQQWDSALDYYLRLADFADEQNDEIDTEVRLSDSHTVRQDRWLRARLARFAKSATEDVRNRLSAEAEKRLAKAIAADNINPARRFIDRFALHPVAIKGRDLFVDRLLRNGDLLEAEMLLRQEARSKDRAVAARATLRLAEMLRKAKRLEDVADCYRRLAFEFGDVECGNGITGKEVVKNLTKDDAVRRWFHPDRSWPEGLVKSSKTYFKQNIPAGTNLIDLNFHGSKRPFFGNRQLKYDQSDRALIAVGPYGNTLWRLSLNNGGQRTYLSVNQGVNHVSARGHLLVVAAGNEYIAVDCADPKSPRILWRRHPDQALSTTGGVGQVEVNAFWAGMQQQTFSSYGLSGRHPWQTALLTDQYMCFRKFRGVVAIDPLSGSELWTYGDLPENCVLFGDENLVFAVPFDGTEATVLRGIDGEKLKTVVVPSMAERLTTIGRNVLVWRVESNRRILELVDPWQDRTLWGPYDFEASAKCSLVGNESLGVMEQNGRFTMFSLPDGRKVIEEKLTAERNLQEIVLLEADGEHFLITHSSQRNRIGQTPRYIRGASSRLIRKGRVYGFNRNGKRLWADFPDGVEVEEQQLLLNQPNRLPILTFASLGYTPNNRNSRWFMSVLMIDKRNGRVVLDEQFDQQAGVLELIGDPAGNTVDVRMQRSNMRLAFTDEALPPITKKKKIEKPSGTFGGVLKALQKLTEQKMRELPLQLPGEMQPELIPPAPEIPKPIPTPQQRRQ
ncbi:MAG: PQQ-binding-like beta-propeller repeat protein [Pirellulales bacterium]|nr:PQQ-binding-like beta-propeller repeat protein [Pirellulales bacterium]